MWETIALCMMFGSLALLYGVVLPLAHYHAYNAPLPHQKELEELDKAYAELADKRAELRKLMR